MLRVDPRAVNDRHALRFVREQRADVKNGELLVDLRENALGPFAQVPFKLVREDVRVHAA
jgi:hypothetical protein